MATLNHTPTTRLEAVNLMLSVIDEAPINSLEVSGLADADVAQQILHEKLRSTQTRRWNFNFETGYILSIDTDGFIYVPLNTLFIDASDVEGDVDVTLRGNRLYDRKNHTYVFTKSLKCDIQFFLEFEELPESVRYYVACAAAHTFQGRMQGSEVMLRFTSDDVRMAWLALCEAEGEEDDLTIFHPNYGPADALRRTS